MMIKLRNGPIMLPLALLAIMNRKGLKIYQLVHKFFRDRSRKLIFGKLGGCKIIGQGEFQTHHQKSEKHAQPFRFTKPYSLNSPSKSAILPADQSPQGCALSPYFRNNKTHSIPSKSPIVCQSSQRLNSH